MPSLKQTPPSLRPSSASTNEAAWASPPEQGLVIVAWVLWGVSLALPGFADTNEVWQGWGILVFGTAVGWMAVPGGLAAYANVAFLWTGVRMSLGRGTPKVMAVTMLILACMAPAIQHSGVPKWGGGSHDVISWGWGAIMWGMAILTMAGAVKVRAARQTVQAAQSSRETPQHPARGVWYFLGGLTLLLLPLGWVSWRQSAQLPPERRQHVMPMGMAFTLKLPLAAPSYTGPASIQDIPPLGADELVVLEIDPALETLAWRGSTAPSVATINNVDGIFDMFFPFPLPRRFVWAQPHQKDAATGVLWQWIPHAYSATDMLEKLRPHRHPRNKGTGKLAWYSTLPSGQAPAVRYRIAAQGQNRIQVSLTRLADGQVLYQQVLDMQPDPALKSDASQRSAHQSTPITLAPKGFDVVLERFFNAQDPDPFVKLAKSAFDTPVHGTPSACPMETVQAGDATHQRQWGERTLVFSPMQDVNRLTVACSNALAAFIDVDEWKTPNERELTVDLDLFDRATLKRIYMEGAYWSVRCGKATESAAAEEDPYRLEERAYMRTFCNNYSHAASTGQALVVQGVTRENTPVPDKPQQRRSRYTLHTNMGDLVVSYQ